METRYQCYISKTEVGDDFESLISSHLFFLRESFNLWRPLLMIALYHQTKTPISFWYRRGLNSRSLIQPSETLPVELTGTHMYCIITLLSQMLDLIKVYPKYIYTKKNYGLTIFAICFVLGYRKVRGTGAEPHSGLGGPWPLQKIFFSH